MNSLSKRENDNLLDEVRKKDREFDKEMEKTDKELVEIKNKLLGKQKEA